MICLLMLECKSVIKNLQNAQTQNKKKFLGNDSRHYFQTVSYKKFLMTTMKPKRGIQSPLLIKQL